MPDDHSTPRPSRHFGTAMSHAGRAGTRILGYVNPPLVRGSTLLHPNCADRAVNHGFKRALSYGTGGTPTHHALEDVVAEIEGGTRCQIVSSGLAAVTTPLLAYLKAGDHCLVPDSVYGPTRRFCDGMLARLGITTTYYVPTIDAAELTALMRPETTVVFLESPGSHTFEMQDVPALAEVAHAHGAKVLMDNTWGIHHFQPFKFGVDVSIQALTKYVAGHSDLILGSITTHAAEDYERVRATAVALGQFASPDDCWLALRGARSLPARLAHQMEAGLTVARWLSEQTQVQSVLHPALPGAPGHALWKRDFTGACSLFGVVLRPEITVAAMHDFIDGLELFGIGASWGGFESLILPTTGTVTRTAGGPAIGQPSLRLHIGMEDVRDLIADLERSFARMQA